MDPHDLIQKHLDGTLSAAEAAGLATALAENPALAGEFAAATRMDAALGEALRESSRTALYTRRLQRAADALPAPKPARKWPLRQAGIAAGIAALLGGAWWLIPAPQNDSPQVAQEKKKTFPIVADSLAPAPGTTANARVARVESAALKRTLRQFYGAGGNLRSVPVSQAVAALESAWKEHAQRDLAAIPIRLADSVQQHYLKSGAEPSISLEIPGVSLLTNLNLLAAQAGLKTVISDTAITLEPDMRADDGTERTWTLPLDQATLIAFVQRAQSEAALASWMPKAEPVVLTDNRITQPVFARRWLSPMGNAAAGASFNYPTEFDPPQTPQVFGDDQTYAAADWREKLHAALPLWEQIDNPPGSADFNVFRETAGLPAACPSTQQTAACIQCHQPTDTQVPAQESAQRSALREKLMAAFLSDQTKAYETLYAEIQQLSERLLSLQVMRTQELALSALNAGTAGATQGLALNFSSEFPAQPNTDDYAIDLNLSPEVIHFEGFINYGTPINTLAYPSPDPDRTLGNLLAAHGFPRGWTPQPNTAGLNGAAVLGTQHALYDAATGQVTATGTLNQLRAASATLEALREAATAGFEVSLRVVDWPADAPADVTGESVSLVRESEWKQAVKDGRAKVIASQSARFRRDDAHTVQAGGDTQITFSSCKQLTGTDITAGVAVNSTPHQTIVGVPITTTASNYKIPAGHWLRFHLSSNASATARTVLISIQPASIPLQ